MLIHIHGRLSAVWLTDDARRYASGGGVRRHRLEHHGACADLRTASDFDIAEDFGTRANHHPFTNFRMAIAAGFPGTAQGNRLQDRDVVFNHRRFPDNDTGGVVEHDPAANLRRRVNINLKRHGNLVLQEDRQRAAAFIP